MNDGVLCDENLIDFDSFTEVMQELLDDASLRIEEDYPVLQMYSEWQDCGYDEDDIMERMGDYLDINIAACFMYKDLREIYIIENR